MGRVARQFRSLSGGILGITILLIVTFFVWNFIATRTPAPISTIGNFAFQRASGQAYAAAPAINTSPYSQNANVGPYI